LRQPILSFTGWRTQVLQIDLQNSDRRYRIIKRAITGMGNRARLKRKEAPGCPMPTVWESKKEIPAHA
jgi:hypothetical protein